MCHRWRHSMPCANCVASVSRRRRGRIDQPLEADRLVLSRANLRPFVVEPTPRHPQRRRDSQPGGLGPAISRPIRCPRPRPRPRNSSPPNAGGNNRRTDMSPRADPSAQSVRAERRRSGPGWPPMIFPPSTTASDSCRGCTALPEHYPGAALAPKMQSKRRHVWWGSQGSGGPDRGRY